MAEKNSDRGRGGSDRSRGSSAGRSGSSRGSGGGRSRDGRSSSDKRSGSSRSGSGSSSSGRGSGRSSDDRSRSSRDARGGAKSDGRRNTRDDRSDDRRSSPPPKRKPWSAEGDLPRWIQDEIARVTPKQKIAQTVEFLQAAAKQFAAGRYGKSLRDAEQAKELSPRDPTIREVLALSAYRLGQWDTALRELRTFRRFTGDTTHMPVEMDVLRALDRPKDVEEVWKQFRKIGGDRATDHEARVVYGSFLLDQGQDRKAWEVTNPKRLGDDPQESELRVWYVASKAAARLGDMPTARRLYEAISTADPAFPGLDELDRSINA